MTTLVTINTPVTMLDAVTAVVTSEALALPSRSVFLGWQVNLSDVPSSISIALEESIDGITWVAIQTIDETVFDSNSAVLEVNDTPSAAQFIRTNVTSNDDALEVTSLLLAKPAA